MPISAMSKDTWWNRLRVEKNIRYKDIIELYGGSVSVWAQRFTGQTMPNYNQIKQLCELFDVDFNRGYAEFKKAHALWKSEGRGAKDGYVKTGISIMRGVQKGERVEVVGQRDPVEITKEEETVETPVEQPTIAPNEVFGVVYGKVPYDTFCAFCDALARVTTEDPLGYIYGKVDYKEFRAIEKALEG